MSTIDAQSTIDDAQRGARRLSFDGRVRDGGRKVATAHLVHLNPMPSDTGEVVRRYRRVLIPEMNTGQLALLIRAAHLVDATTYSKVQGQPIFAEDLENEILRVSGDLER